MSCVTGVAVTPVRPLLGGPRMSSGWGGLVTRKTTPGSGGWDSQLPDPPGGGGLGTDFKRVAPNLIHRVSAVEPGSRLWASELSADPGRAAKGLAGDRPRHTPPHGWRS